MKVFRNHVLPPLIIAGAFIGYWYLLAYVVIKLEVRFILPPPHRVLSDGILKSPAFQKTMEGLWETSKVVLLGFALAALLGIWIALIMSQARWVERTLFPYAIILQAVPIVAIVPLIGIWAGYGFTSKVIVTVLISIFPMITNTLFGLKSVEAGMHDLFNIYSPRGQIRSRFAKITKLHFRVAVPSIFTGLRTSAGLAVVGTIVGEFFFKQGTTTGLGRLILEAYKPQSGKGPELYAAIIITCLLGLVLFWMVSLSGKYFTRYLR